MPHLDRVSVLDADERCPRLPIVDGGEAYAVVWPGIGAEMRSMSRISLQPDGSTIRLSHPTEAVYYVMDGDGTVADPDAGTSDALVVGSMIHVEPGTAYVYRAGSKGMELVGGPCPADPALYATLK